MKTRLCATLLTLSIFSFAQRNGMIFLVRHAERSSEGGDAAMLNTVGEQRAKCLAKTLERTGITQIYVTESKRTQQTADPLAEELQLQPKIAPRDDVDGLVKNLKAGGSAKVLVIAHADTLPKILRQLGAGSLPEAKPDGKAESLSLIRYCPASE